MIPSVITALVPFVLPYVGPALAALIGLLFAAVVKLLVKVRNEKIKHAGLALADAAKKGFIFAETKVAPALRGPDGKLSPDAGAQVKVAAVAAAMEYLKDNAIDDVRAALKKSDADLELDLGEHMDVIASNNVSSSPSAIAGTVVTLPSGAKLVVPGGK